MNVIQKKNIRITSDLSITALELENQWSNVLKSLKENYFLLRILYQIQYQSNLRIEYQYF